MTLDVENLRVRYGAVTAVQEVSFRIGQGEVVALVGANGAGKSSILKALMALTEHQASKISIDGLSVERSNTRGRLEAGISLSPEGRHVFPELTVRENIDIGFTGAESKQELARRQAMYARFPRLREREFQAAGSLSGGEQQMLAIARAVMAGPRVLLLDEPTLGLAPIVVRELSKTIRDFAAGGMAVLVAEQNAEMALSVADRGYVLQSGRIAQEGSAAELKASDSVRVAFLGM